MKRFPAVATFFLIFALFTVTAAPSETLAAPDYTIDRYHISVSVNEDNTFDITEDIDANFKEYRHGLIRLIPTRNEVVRLDGTVSRNRASVSDVSVNEPFTINNENGNKAIKIGDPDATVKGLKNYKIQYKYNIGKDTGKGYDELYFNLIGTDWDTTISEISFTINMPKSFDKSKLGFSAGAMSSTNSDNIAYSVNDKVIRGRYLGALGPGEGLTVRLELPEGYFIGAKSNADYMMLLTIPISIFLFLLFFNTWKKYGGRRSEVVETVEFYPPYGLNSAEVGFWYRDGEASDTDIISLLIYLANLGYLTISEDTPTEGEAKSFFKPKTRGNQKGFVISKAKDYDGTNPHEAAFIKGLFKKKPGLIQGLLKTHQAIQRLNASHASSDSNPKTKPRTFSLTLRPALKSHTATDSTATGERALSDSSPSAGEAEETVSLVRESDLRNWFYITINSIKENLNSKENKSKIYEKSSLGHGWKGVLAIIAIYLMITLRPVIAYGGFSAMLVSLIFVPIGFTVLICAIIWAPSFMKIMLILWGAMFGGAPWYLMVIPAVLTDTPSTLAYGAGLISIVGILIIIRFMPKRTPLANATLGKIRGFRRFLDLAEKPRLEELVESDPAYFYNILPFTYVLGLSDKWIKKFETIAMRPPDWYHGGTAYSHAAFGAFISSTMRSANSSMASRPSSSSSGSGSGGGSSGGGSGGGGGRSW